MKTGTLFEAKEKAKLEEAKNCIINIIDSYCPTSFCDEMTGYEWAKILREIADEVED